MSEWASLRVGLLGVGLLIVLALAGWGVETATYEDRGYSELRRCLVDEKGAVVDETTDPIAETAELGALRTVIETNGVTVSVASSQERAERIAANYGSVGGDLGERLELRGRTVFLWDRPPSPTQRQTLYDCTD
jgi:hypothetical protein